jgi:arginine-tRNA-protein transferase
MFLSVQLTTVPAAYDAEAYALYVKYQMRVHHDPPSKLTPDGYANFLCNSPIARSDASGIARVRGSGSEEGVCGSFHQHYRVDGRLIAVGVVDMCVYIYFSMPFTHCRIFLRIFIAQRFDFF